MSEGDDRRAVEQELAAELLASGLSYGEVAEELGRTARTIGRWMADPKFRRSVSERRTQRLAEVTGRLAMSAPDVVGQVRYEVFEAESSADRVRAAGLFMRLLMQLRRDAELEDRLGAVERRLGLLDNAETPSTDEEGEQR
jgi:transcriptional regulator with XRE-family HTH domain